MVALRKKTKNSIWKILRVSSKVNGIQFWDLNSVWVKQVVSKANGRFVNPDASWNVFVVLVMGTSGAMQFHFCLFFIELHTQVRNQLRSSEVDQSINSN